MQLRVFMEPIYFKDNLKTFEAQFPKKLRTTEAHFEFTGPYKKKKSVPFSYFSAREVPCTDHACSRARGLTLSLLF